MTLSVQEMLENKGIKAKEKHLEILEGRWKGMQELRGNLEDVNINDADIGMRNIAGGDHIE